MALKGTLGDFSLIDIMQLVDLGKKTGVVIVHGRRGDEQLEGRLYFAEGKIHSAELADLVGEEAAFTLFTATDGPFEFVEMAQLPPRNVHVSNEVVIMEGVGRQDQWASIARRVPSGELIFRLVPNPRPTSHEINFEVDKWRVLTLINGKTSVDQIVQRSGLSRFRAYQILAELVEAGLAEERFELPPALETYTELEKVAVATIGNSARMLLHDAFRRAGVDPRDANTSAPGVLQAIKIFEQATTLLLGPARAHGLADQLRTLVPAVV
jgi:hypothetical protein